MKQKDVKRGQCGNERRGDMRRGPEKQMRGEEVNEFLKKTSELLY